MRRKRGSHSRKRRGPQLGIFPKDPAERSDPRTNCEHGIEVAAANLPVTGSDVDLLETCSLQNAAHAAGVGEREWSGRVRIASGLRRQMCGRCPKRQHVERVFLQRSPADECQSSARPEAATNVDERRGWVSEEHHPKARERGVERSGLERKYLGICLNEPHTGASLRRAPRERQHRSRQIDAHDRAVRCDRPDEIQRRLAPATSDVQDALTRAQRKPLQGAAAQWSELQFQGLAHLRPRAQA